MLLGLALPLHAQTLGDAALAKIDFEQKLNAQITPSLPFLDEDGHPVTLAAYLGRKPIVLVLGYYRCPMLCSIILNGFIEGLQQMKWSIGREFDVICVSIDPNETPALASAKKRTYLKRYARSSAAQGWHFLTGSKSSIEALTGEVGFHYAYEPATKQYAHPSGVVILTPKGKVSGYQLGVTFPGAPLRTAIAQAAEDQIGSPVARLILLCFHYNPITGKYGAVIMNTIRVLGAFTIIGLAALVVRLARRTVPLRPQPAARA